MAIRSVAIPLLSGGALVLGLAAFSWLRAKRAPREAIGPSTPRKAGLEGEGASATQPRPNAPSGDEAAPASGEAPELFEVLELDVDFEEELVAAAAPPARSAVDIGPMFLARVTDALSPFGDEFEHEHFDIDQLGPQRMPSEVTAARAVNGEAHADDEAPRSERRPSVSGGWSRP